jgi:hypothetical protein
LDGRLKINLVGGECYERRVSLHWCIMVVRWSSRCNWGRYSFLKVSRGNICGRGVKVTVVRGLRGKRKVHPRRMHWEWNLHPRRLGEWGVNAWRYWLVTSAP